MRVMRYCRIMRTTVNIDNHLLDAAKRRASERGMTLGELVEDGLRLELARARERRIPPPLRPSQGRGGMNPSIDPTSNRSVWEFLDAGLPPEKLR